jgi:hypothetical protein
MRCSRKNGVRLVAALLAAIVGGCLIFALAGPSAREQNPTGTLYLVSTDANTPSLRAVARETVCAERNLVVITHGWYEHESWPGEMALAIARRVDLDDWQCGWYDWRAQARRLRPTDATRIGRDRIGPALARTTGGTST